MMVSPYSQAAVDLQHLLPGNVTANPEIPVHFKSSPFKSIDDPRVPPNGLALAAEFEREILC